MKYMINVITNYGFRPSENEFEYVKGNWTVRIDGENIEVFNNPDLDKVGKYFIAPINKVDLEQLLSEIDDFIMR